VKGGIHADEPGCDLAAFASREGVILQISRRCWLATMSCGLVSIISPPLQA
jgi:hypothetical protein